MWDGRIALCRLSFRRPMPATAQSIAHANGPDASRDREGAVPVPRTFPHSQAALAVPHIHHVNVSAQPDIVSKIPARVIGIFVDHDLVGIPQPVAAIAEING